MSFNHPTPWHLEDKVNPDSVWPILDARNKPVLMRFPGFNDPDLGTSKEIVDAMNWYEEFDTADKDVLMERDNLRKQVDNHLHELARQSEEIDRLQRMLRDILTYCHDATFVQECDRPDAQSRSLNGIYEIARKVEDMKNE